MKKARLMIQLPIPLKRFILKLIEERIQEMEKKGLLPKGKLLSW